MKALAISLHPDMLSNLVDGGIITEPQLVSDPDELASWVVDGFYNALIVDLDASGFGTFFPRVLRKKGIPIPIVGIGKATSWDGWSDHRAEFLEQGGDDLLRAPGNRRELLASVRAASRRSLGGTIDIITFVAEDLELKINIARKSVSLNGELVHLTHQETTLIMTLASHRNKIVSKETLLTSLYPNEADQAEIKIVDVFICKIRKKFGFVHPAAGKFLETIWGRGYQLTEGFTTRTSLLAI